MNIFKCVSTNNQKYAKVLEGKLCKVEVGIDGHGIKRAQLSVLNSDTFVSTSEVKEILKGNDGKIITLITENSVYVIEKYVVAA